MVAVVFLDPSAAKGPNSRELFASRKGLEAKLRTIVDHIVGSVRVPQSPMTFAIYGPWGAGKSSALNWLMDELDRHKRRDNLPLTMSTYSAPLWRNFADVRATLAYEIMNGISQDQPETLHDITQTLAGLLGLKFSAHPDEGNLHVAVTFMTILARLPNAPAVVEAELQRRARRLRDGAAAGELRPVHVQFIDDLDRCDLEFTASLLHAMHYWQNTDYCVIFVVAASKEHVYRAFRDYPGYDGTDPGQALEKYIHLSVDLPELLVTPREVADFLHQLVARVTADGGLPAEVASELDRMIDTSVQDYPRGVLAPLLRIGGDSVTPRAVKHRLNTFLSDLSAQEGDLDPQTWKNLVIRAYWPEFWSRDVAPLERRPTTVDLVWQGRVERVVRLRAVGRELLRFWDMAAADVAPMLSHLGRRYGIDVSGVDPVLAMYLAAEPAWEPPSDGLDHDGAQPGSQRGFLEPDEPHEGEEQSGQIALPPRDEALLVSIQAEQAANQGDAPAVRTHLLRIIELFRTQPPNTISAATLGNCALYAERVRLSDLAEVLHRAALATDRNHYNVMQNYLEFIIDNRREGDYPLAEELLSRLRSDGRDHRPARTAALAVRLHRLLGRQPEDISQIVNELLAAIDRAPSVDALTQLLAIGIELVGADRVRHACRVVGLAATDDDQRYTVLRLLADELSDSSDPRDENEAADIYRFLLRSGLAGNRGAKDEDAIMHNLANLLALRGWQRTAIRLWEHLYRGRARNDTTIRRPFAVTLKYADFDTQATQVLRGEPLAPLDLTPEEVPPRLAPEADAWWERLEIVRHPPAESPVPGLLDPLPEAVGGEAE